MNLYLLNIITEWGVNMQCPNCGGVLDETGKCMICKTNKNIKLTEDGKIVTNNNQFDTFLRLSEYCKEREDS